MWLLQSSNFTNEIITAQQFKDYSKDKAYEKCVLPHATQLPQSHFPILTCLCHLVLTILHHGVSASREIPTHDPTEQIRKNQHSAKVQKNFKSSVR